MATVASLSRRRVAQPPSANDETTSRGWVQSFCSAVNVLDAGATGDGTTDDTAAIQAAINFIDARGGGRVLFPVGTFRTSAPLEQPESVILEGVSPIRITYGGMEPPPSVIRPTSGHSGPAVVRMRGKTETSRTYEHTGARVRYLTIDGSSGPASLKGIALYALVREAVIEDCTVYKVSDAGFWCGAGATATTTMPQSLRYRRCVAHQCGGAGFSFSNVPDSILDDCLSIGGSWVGFYLAGFVHGALNNCKAEWNSQHGYYVVSGYYGTGQGAGGLALTNCQTDRNGYDGVRIESTGSAGIALTGCLLRRDGRNNGAGGGGYAGLRVNGASNPVSVDNVIVYPGVDDDGTQTASPQVGVSANGATGGVRVNSGVIHAITTPVTDGGSNASFIVDPACSQAVGTTSGFARRLPDMVGRDPVNDDSQKYGDAWASCPRKQATTTAAITNGYVTQTGQLARRAFTPAALRFYLSAVGASTSSNAVLAFEILAGTSITSLTSRGTATLSGIGTAGLNQLTVANAQPIQAGEFVFVVFLPTGYTTNASLQFTPAGPPAPLVSPATARYDGYSASGQTTLPAKPYNANGVATASGTTPWIALTAA